MATPSAAKAGRRPTPAVRLGIDQPRVSDLLRNRFERFSIDKLVTLLSMLGVRVDKVLDRALLAEEV